MANIFELGSNQEAYNKLQSVKNKFMMDVTAEIEADKLKLIENHRKHYIFNTYEEALEWCVKNTDTYIQWHNKILFWDEVKNKFKSYEQEYDLDGIICHDVIRYYTKDELLKGVQDHIEYCNKNIQNKPT